ncbi:MAG: CD1375 family protein [Bacillota bacterium]
MIEIYCKLVLEGRRTIEQVPLRYRAEIQVVLSSSLHLREVV